MTYCPLITQTLRIISVRCIPPELSRDQRHNPEQRFCFLLGFTLSIGSYGQLNISLYNKRDYFNFHITNSPFLSSNIQSSPAYCVFISQLIIRDDARACPSYECFILRAVRLSNKLLGQGYVKERLRSSLRKFYGRYVDLIKQHEAPSPESYTTFWMITLYSDTLHYQTLHQFLTLLLI